MDFQVFPAFNLSNIPLKYTRKQLVWFLNFFLYRRDENDQLSIDQIRLYPGGNSQFAVVSGVKKKFGEIKALLTMRCIEELPLFVNYDFGHVRTGFGRPINQTLATRDLFQNFHMLHHGNLQNFFVQDIAQAIPYGYVCSRVVLRNFTKPVNLGLIFQVGRVLSFLYKPEESLLIINYHSLLDKVQALCYLSNNDVFATDGYFENCAIIRKQGLGNLDEKAREGMLDIRDLEQQHGYVPFDEFDQKLITLPPLKSTFTACYKCNGKGALILQGVTMCLKYYVAKCDACDYDSQAEDPLANGFPVKFNGEKFTRVRIGRNDFRIMNGFRKALNVVHTPLKFLYSDPWEARNIIGEIVANEARTQEQLFTYENQTFGTLRDVTQVVGENEEYLYLFTILVAKTSSWRKEKLHRFHEISFDVTYRHILSLDDTFLVSTKSANIAHIHNFSGGDLLLKCKVAMPFPSVFLSQQKMCIHPFSIHREYSAAISVLTEWANSPDEPRFAILEKLLLGIDPSFDLPKDLVSESPMILDDLNEDQKHAVLQSRRVRLNVVHCPPATGKNITVAATALELARTEEGIIICVTKSNEAANEMCQAIGERRASFPGAYDEISFVRMVSKKIQEIYFRNLYNAKDSGVTFPYLHEKIASHDLFGTEAGLPEIFQKIDNHGFDMLTTWEMHTLTQHINEIEGRVVRGTRILVTTAATLFDGRVFHHLFGPFLQADELVTLNTVLIDDGGHIPMPLMIPLLAFYAKRHIVFGDPDLLPPIVKSTSAEAAGLSISIMQFLRHSLARTHPCLWHTLRLQSSMPAVICRLLSEMTYSNQLRCDPFHRRKLPEVDQLRVTVNRAVPASRTSDMLLVPHDSAEQILRFGSKFNTFEANLVVRLASRLCGFGVPQDKITIISPYEDQRKLLLNFLSQSELTDRIQVFTPTSYAGKYNDIIIASMVCSKRMKDNGYCQSHHRRLTTILSFTRQFLFFVLNYETYTEKDDDELYMKSFQNALYRTPEVFLY